MGHDAVFCARYMPVRTIADATVPPRDPDFARWVCQPKQQITFTGERRAEANQIATTQIIERPQ